MKKLMFVAVVAAASVASAMTHVSTKTKGHYEKTECGKVWIEATDACGSAHKVAITLKTTVPQSKTTKKATSCNPGECTSPTFHVRENCCRNISLHLISALFSLQNPVKQNLSII